MLTLYWYTKKVGYKLACKIYNRKKPKKQKAPAEQTIPENQ